MVSKAGKGEKREKSQKEKRNRRRKLNSKFVLLLGTQRVTCISFLCQIVEHGGFYRTSDHIWVTIERIQFVGACNPPTDPGTINHVRGGHKVIHVLIVFFS